MVSSRSYPSLVLLKDQPCKVPPGGVFPYKNRQGGAPCGCWKEPLRHTKTVSCGLGLKFFSPRRGTNSKQCIMFSHLFWLNVLKDTTKAPTVDFLKLDAVSRTKTAFLTPERCDDQSHPFYIGSISPWGFPYKVGFWHLIIHYYFGNVDVFSGSFDYDKNFSDWKEL